MASSTLLWNISVTSSNFQHKAIIGSGTEGTILPMTFRQSEPDKAPDNLKVRQSGIDSDMSGCQLDEFHISQSEAFKPQMTKDFHSSFSKSEKYNSCGDKIEITESSDDKILSAINTDSINVPPQKGCFRCTSCKECKKNHLPDANGTSRDYQKISEFWE